MAKAVLAPATLTMISDGSVDDSELAQLANLCSFSPMFFGLVSEQIVKLINENIQEFQSKGAQAYTEEVASILSMPMRETAMVFSIRIVLADGHLDEGEKNSLGGIATVFGIPQQTFEMMFNVMIMLQRGPQATG
ncbi:tellurite resistance TerB family protein [Halovulum sp. GXIMD14793]